MNTGLNAAERFIYELCQRSFLRLWSYANPRGKEPGKELCDVLVLCPPDVIIFSVKDIDYKESGRPEIDRPRWLKRAVEGSAKQIYGAERHIRSSENVIRADGSLGWPLPAPGELRIHRVAVAAGNRGKVPLPFGDFGKGFVHVLDEQSAYTLLRQLDTISEFLEYLTAKETFCAGVKHLVQVREEDLLAIYLQSGRRFPDQGRDVLLVPDELWESFKRKPEVAAKKTADAASYVWDGLIEVFARDILGNNLEPTASRFDAERAVRIMAREDRFSRRILGEAFREFLLESAQHSLARMLVAPSGIVYVFLASPRELARNDRQMELQLRCFVALGSNQGRTTAVGIGTEQYKSDGYSLDIAIHHQPHWTDEHTLAVTGIQKDLGYFAAPRVTRQSFDEYPLQASTERKDATSSCRL